MSNGPIPPQVDPRKLADRGISLKGVLPASSLPRLCEQFVELPSDVTVQMSFERNEQRLPLIHGLFAVEGKMICQRCLEPVTVPVQGEATYAVVHPDSDISVPKALDVLEVGEEPLDVLALIEDELLLALPIVALHDPSVCQQPAGQDEPEPSENGASRSNPFGVLAQLKRDPNV